MKTELSVVILTKNSDKYLDRVLKSVTFADEVIVYDNGSKDKTLAIARNFKNVKIFVDTDWEGFGKQKQKAVDKTRHNWVFVLDSDEIFTYELEQEVKNIIKTPQFLAYKVPRLNNFFGKWIRHGGLYPDYSIRLFDKRRCKFNDAMVHEKVQCNEVGKLKSYFLHYAYDNVDEFIEKQNRYSSLNKKKNILKAFLSPKWKFINIFFIKRGFLDGWIGYIIAKLYSQYTFWKYIK